MTSSCEACGWVAAIGAMLAFGSFGVPIKSKVAQTLDIDPLVMQTYKTTMCFVTSWLVLFYVKELRFTPWGFVSGLFWVPGGIGTIFAIKNAGLAIGIGVGSSFIVLVSFTWGIFVFEEHVHNRIHACFAVGMMMMGLLGMAYYSAPDVIQEELQEEREDVRGQYASLSIESSSSDEELALPEQLSDAEVHDNFPVRGDAMENDMLTLNDDAHTILMGMKWSRRSLGILSAMFAGTYGGSVMVPMKWAPADAKGMNYLISFATGATTVNLSLWIIRFLYLSCSRGSWSAGYAALPSLYVTKMWKYGGACGLLWSVGNVFSIFSIQYLGQGVGYSVVQSSILVSGVWGIFYFREVQGSKTIAKWLLSATMAVSGIVLLSYEHHKY